MRCSSLAQTSTVLSGCWAASSATTAASLFQRRPCPGAWPRQDGVDGASAPTSQLPSGPPSRAAAPPGPAPARKPSRPPPSGWSTTPHRAAAHASDPGSCSAGQVSNRMGVCRCGAAGRPEPADPGRCSGPGDAQPIAGHTTPWLRPRRCGALWPEARAPEGAAPRSHPCTSDTAAPAPIRSDDRLHAPWLASVPHDT